MDMPMPSVSPEIADLPLSDPRCILAADGCIAFYAGQNASQSATPWDGQFLYGHYLTYYYLIVIALASASYYSMWWMDGRTCSKSDRNTPSFTDKLNAYRRFIGYRRVDTKYLDLPSAGVSILLGISSLVIMVLVFAERPYYREYLGFGSPPIAIRSGLLAFACTPILVALAGKVNVITFLTGISHERLNIIHQFIGWATFVLSLIHTIPFFIAVDRMGDLDSQAAEFYGTL